MTVVADSGALFASLDRHDAWHDRVVKWFETAAAEVLIPVTTLPEIAWMLSRRIGPAAEARFVRTLADGDVVVEGLEPADYPRIRDLVEAYQDLPLGFVDASVVAIAERLDVSAILTTDRRDFGVVRPVHCPRFRLLP